MEAATGIPFRVVWQISGGPSSRSYADILLQYGVALIGPGDAGSWMSERDDDEFEGGFVRRFASELAVGDVLLLRTGIASIAALGVVASEYQYVNAFDDVNGWDLQHTRRVRWSQLPNAHRFGTPVFGANPPRCSRVWNDEAIDFAYRFLQSPPTNWQTARLPELPEEEPLLEVVPPELQEIVASAADLVPLLQDRQRFGEAASEDELICHFVVPFLHALGWPSERIAVQWRSIDVAVFRALPRTVENCHLAIEAKRLGAGVEGALEQVKRYVGAIGLTCQVVVTDGIRYRMYAQDRNFEPVSYANLIRLKQSASHLFAQMRRR
jgi:hypothetical protein